MKKIILNNTIIYRLSDKEYIKYTSNPALKLIRNELIEDLAYNTAGETYSLYNIGDQYLYNLGGTVYYLSDDTLGFNILLSNAKCYQNTYKYRFLNEEKINDLFADDNLNKNVSSFCKRNNIPINKIGIKNIKEEISKLKKDAFEYDIEYLSIIIYINKKELDDIKMLDFGIGNKGVAFLMINSKSGNEFSPIDTLIKIFENSKICSL